MSSPKCHGTGFVEIFAHVKNGVRFDCGGTGTLEGAIIKVTTKLGAPGITGLKAAFIVADAVLADPKAVGPTKTIEDSNVLNSGGQKTHDRYRALRALITN